MRWKISVLSIIVSKIMKQIYCLHSSCGLVVTLVSSICLFTQWPNLDITIAHGRLKSQTFPEEKSKYYSLGQAKKDSNSLYMIKWREREREMQYKYLIFWNTNFMLTTSFTAFIQRNWCGEKGITFYSVSEFGRQLFF